MTSSPTTAASPAAASTDAGGAAQPSTLDRLLAAGHPGPATRTDLAARIDATDPHTRELLTRIAETGIDASTITGMLNGSELAALQRLSELGLEPAVLGAIAENDYFERTVRALDAGVPLDDILRVCRPGQRGPITVSQLYRLHHDNTPAHVIDLILNRPDNVASEIGRLHDGGCAWDDLALALTTRAPIDQLAFNHTVLRPNTLIAAGLTQRVTYLACLLEALIGGEGTTFDLLPAAAAIDGQPWEATALTLLGDDPRATATSITAAILAARLLDDDPVLADQLAGRGTTTALEEWLHTHIENYQGHIDNDTIYQDALVAYAAAAAGQPWATPTTMSDEQPTITLAAHVTQARVAGRAAASRTRVTRVTAPAAQKDSHGRSGH
jgi:hypothetical protein